MKRRRFLIPAFIGGLILVLGASYGGTPSSDPHCIVDARGALANGDEFFGHATINMDFSAAPGGLWRHFIPSTASSPEAVFVGRIERGICIRNSRTSIQLFGTGRYSGRSVAFEFFGQDAATDSYLMVIRDADGNFVYTALGDLASGDILVTFP